VPKDPKRAVELYTVSCDGGIPNGCSALAACYEAGTGVRADPARALGLYRAACDGGQEQACRSATRLAGAH
jgi:TPR repeat protein